MKKRRIVQAAAIAGIVTAGVIVAGASPAAAATGSQKYGACSALWAWIDRDQWGDVRANAQMGYGQVNEVWVQIYNSSHQQVASAHSGPNFWGYGASYTQTNWVWVGASAQVTVLAEGTNYEALCGGEALSTGFTNPL